MAKKSKKSLPVDTPCEVNAAERKRWQAEDDLRTLQRAREIKNDASRVKSALALANEQISALKSVGKTK